MEGGVCDGYFRVAEPAAARGTLEKEDPIVVCKLRSDEAKDAKG
jgi:hypothetical protein